MVKQNEAPRLLLRLEAFADESWQSYAQRMAQHNYPEAPQLVPTLFREWLKAAHRQDAFDLPRHSASLLWLAHLMWLKPAELYAMSLHRFASLINSDETVTNLGYRLLTSRSTQHILPDSQSRYCPQCLQEAVYHRLHWSHALVTTCLRHKSLLCDCCPSCHLPSSLSAIVKACCPACGATLAAENGFDLSLDTFGLAVQAWLYAALFGINEETVLLNSPPLETRASYAFLHDLFELLNLRSVGTFQHQLRGLKLANKHPLYPLLQRHLQFVTAFKVLQDWPQNFHHFIAAYRRLSAWDGKEQGGLPADLGQLYRLLLRNWQQPSLQAVQAAFDSYFLAHYARSFHVRKAAWYLKHPSIKEQMPYLTYLEAASILRLEPASLTTLAENQLLERQRSSDSHHFLFSRSSVLELDKRWSQALPLDAILSRFGISPSLARTIFAAYTADTLAGNLLSLRYPLSFLLRLRSMAHPSTTFDSQVISLKAGLEQILEMQADIISAFLTKIWNGRLLIYLQAANDMALRLDSFYCKTEDLKAHWGTA